jgi:hypothetical protein
MKLEPSHRLKTFGLAAAVLLSVLAAGTTWLDESVPMDTLLASAETAAPNADESVFVQSGGVVPDTDDEALSGQEAVRHAALAASYTTALR